MQPAKILIFLLAAFLVYTFLLPWIGVTGFLGMALFTVGLLMAIRVWANQKWAFPWPVKGTWVAVILIVGAFMGGLFSMETLSGLGAALVPGEAIVTPISPEPVSAADCRSQVTEELRGKAATLRVNAWDMESNTPYSAAVDLTTECWIFKNGNQPINFISNSSDTSDASISGFVVGDTVYIYCGGASYYTDPIEAYCVETEAPQLSINTHTIDAESDIQITGYDDSGATALSAGTTDQEDYYITLGAGGEETVYLKLKVNSANAAYDHCAWGTVAMANLTSFKPASGYTKSITPLWATDVAIEVNATGSITATSSYGIWKRDGGTYRLHEWDSIKPQFVVKADATGDPVQNNNDLGSTSVLAVALSVDCQYARGTDGRIYYDYYEHTDAEDDVGLAETEANPYGKEVGVIIEAR